MVLTRKLLRELARAKGQTAAVLTVTGVGVLLFVASAAAYQDLRDSYARTQRELALAGLHVDVTRATPDDVRRAGTLPGVQEADARAVAELPAAVGDHRVALRVLSLPDSGQPRLDRVLVLSGKLPTGPSEILLEKHLAQHHHLAAGDSLVVMSGGVRRSLTVSGVGESAEYLWVTRDENDIFPDPDAFGVAWMRRSSLRALAAVLLPGSPGLPGLAIAADDDSSNQLLLDPAAPADDAAVLSALKASLGPDAVLAATPAAKLPGIRLLEMDVDGYKQMAAFFPIFFLGVAAFILASILARLVDAQRPIIGTFAALGVGRARLLAHYLAFALVLGGAGALLGALASIPLSPAMTRAYAEDLGIPFVASRMHWDLVAYGLVTALAVALLAGLVPALHASGLPPAEAMRPPKPSAGPLAKAARRLGGPLSLRLATRDLLGRPLRSLSTTVGVAAALVLVLATGGLLDSMATMLDAIFGGSRRYDVRVDLAAPEPLAAVQQRFSALPGVAHVEGLVAAPASLSAGTHTATALLQGLPAGSSLLRSLDLDGQVVDPAPGGVVLTRALARSLGVKPGDTVRLRIAPLPEAASFRVTGFADAALGKTATVGLADLQRDFAMAGEVTSVALKAAPGQAAALDRAVSQLPEVAHVENAYALREQMSGLMALGWVFLFVMLGAGVVLASAILFNTATLGILERRRELATLRALGRTLREIGAGLTVEHAGLAVIGLGLGLPLSILATKRFLALYSSQLFTLPFVFTARTVLTACLGVVGVLLVAQWPALREVARTSLAEAVRVRDG